MQRMHYLPKEPVQRRHTDQGVLDNFIFDVILLLSFKPHGKIRVPVDPDL